MAGKKGNHDGKIFAGNLTLVSRLFANDWKRRAKRGRVYV
jgi:hypothetical protein